MPDEKSGYILEYLKKSGATNTFKLAHTLNIKRDRLLEILKNLEKQGAVRIVLGNVEFLSYPSKAKIVEKRLEEKPKAIRIKKRKRQRRKLLREKHELQIVKEEIENQRLYIEKLKAKIRELEQRPKIIRKIIVKKVEPKPLQAPQPVKIEIEKKEKRIIRKRKLIKKKPIRHRIRKIKLKEIRLPQKAAKFLLKIKKPKINIKRFVSFFKGGK